MSDLVCAECGMEASYADANIADIHKTCEDTRTAHTPEGKRTATVPAKHDWVEA